MTNGRLVVPGYDAVEMLGFGASGEVWLARETATGDPVALKRVRAAVTDGLAARDRIRREAAVLAAIDHPHIVRLRSVITLPDELVLVLEHAAGGSLAGLLAVRGRLDAGEVVTLGAPLAQALAAVHERGVVHGDVSPGNVLWTADGRPLLADLGVARLVGEGPRDLEATGGFVDPALLRTGIPGPASDVHGLAAVCFAALTGVPPYAGGVRRDLLALAPTTPPALAGVLERALSPVADDRPSAAAFAAALYDAVAPVPVRFPATTGDVSRPTPGGRTAPALVARIASAPAADATSAASSVAGAADAMTHRLRAASKPEADVPVGAHRRTRAGRRWRWRPLTGIAAVAGGLVLAVVVGVAWAGADDAPTGGALAARSVPADATVPPKPSPQPTTSGRTPATTSGPTPATTSGPTPATTSGRAAPTVASADPAVDWVVVLDDLYAAREEAFARGDPALLSQVYADGSPDLTYTEHNLAALQEQGRRAHGVRLRVISANPSGQPPPGTPRGESIVVRTVDRLDAAVLVDAGGVTRARIPARGPAEADVTLTRSGGRWRIVETRGIPAGG